MRRSNVSRHVGRRRATRRRRAVGPTAPANDRRMRLRAQLSAAVARARAWANAMSGLGRVARHWFGWNVSRSAWRKVTERIRTAGLIVPSSLAAVLEVARDRRACRAARLHRACAAVRQRLAGIRLPEIPGGDPVIFGAATGIAIILGAGLVVFVGSALREPAGEPQTGRIVSDEGLGRFSSRDGLTPAPLPRHAPAPDRRDAITWHEHAPSRDVDLRADAAEIPDSTDVASTDAPADEDENIAAAMPLLDMPSGHREDLAPSTPELSPPHTPYPHPEARPLAPAPRPQWLANAVQPQRRPGNKPMIAIVIDDAGIAEARTARAIELPAPLTIAFIPYGRNLEQQTRQARRNGHELLLHIPMEPDNSAADPGPNALLTSLDGDEIMRRFRWALSRFEGYVGVNNHMGSKFMARPDLVAPLLAEMNARGLMFLDSRTDKSTVGAELALNMRLPHASRQVFLDNDLDAGKITAQLKRLESMALRQGHAIAIGHPHDMTVDVLSRWIPEARARGFDLVPVTAIVKLAYGGDSQSQLASARGGETDRLLGSAQ